MALQAIEQPVPESVTATKRVALRFISGKYQGGEYLLGDQPELLIGRSSELDMVLVEDMVSRKHARIIIEDSGFAIEDLGSTNGTFVNGERIKKANLKEGDRVLIGTSILKVVRVDPSESSASRRRVDESPNSSRTGHYARTMAGSIEEIPLPDLLQLFATSKKTCVLLIRSDVDEARICLRKGVVVFASIRDLEDVAPLKSVFRILTWTHGSFELLPSDESPIENEISVSVHELLLEGLRQMDELNVLRDSLPDANAHLDIARPLGAPLRNLSPAELDVLELAHTYGHFATVLNKSALTDLDTARAIVKLVDAGYLRAA